MKNILIVEDDPICCLLMSKYLNKLGYSDIAIANNGKDALESITRAAGDPDRLPDVIFLDLNMPVMDGFSFLKAFKTLSGELMKDIKVVITSSSDEPSDIRQAKRMNADNYLIKPVLASHLDELLSEYAQPFMKRFLSASVFTAY